MPYFKVCSPQYESIQAMNEVEKLVIISMIMK